MNTKFNAAYWNVLIECFLIAMVLLPKTSTAAMPCGQAEQPLEGIKHVFIRVSVEELRFPTIDRKTVEGEIAGQIIKELEIVGITGIVVSPETKESGKSPDGIIEASYSERIYGKLQKEYNKPDDKGIMGYDYMTEAKIRVSLLSGLKGREVFQKDFSSKSAYHAVNVPDSNLDLRGSAFEGLLESMHGMLKSVQRSLPLCASYRLWEKIPWSMGVIDDVLIFPSKDGGIDLYSIKDATNIEKKISLHLSFIKEDRVSHIVGQEGNLLIFGSSGYPENSLPLYFVDFSNPQEPKLVGQYVTLGQIEQVGKIGNYLVVTGGGGGRAAEILEFSSPANVQSAKLKPEVQDALKYCRNFAIDGNRLYVVHTFSKMIDIIKLTDAGGLELAGKFEAELPVSGIAAASGMIYALVPEGKDHFMRVQVYDATQPQNVRLLSRLDTGERSISNLDQLFVSPGHLLAVLEKVVVASIAKDSHLNIEGYIDTPEHTVALSVIPERNLLILLGATFELGVEGSERGTISIYGLPSSLR